MAGRHRRPRRTAERFRTALLKGAVVLLLCLLANGTYRAVQAAQAGSRGKAALLRAEHDLDAHRPDEARRQLLEARHDFRQVRRHLHDTGPLLAVAHVVPLVRVQARGVEAFADAGVALTDAGIGLVDSAGGLLAPTEDRSPLSGSVEALKAVHDSLQRAQAALEAAGGRLRSLDGYRLLGPLGAARSDMLTQLPRITTRASSAERGLDALIVFAGGSGPRRYLFFSQNPDELRPTGGFLGMYGVLEADATQVRLERFAPIEEWLVAHPRAVVPADQAPSALRLSSPPSVQSLANVNASADWRQAAVLAAELWKRGGEPPVDGIISVSPGFLARVLEVLGPIEVPSYGETVSASNVVERFDFYTRQAEVAATSNSNRKAFVAELGQRVMQRLLTAPRSKWEPLAAVIGEAFDARQAMASSTTDRVVSDALAERGWDGALPAARGDFFFDSEFQYGAKYARSLHRTYDHHVELHGDGSARVTTTITIDNPLPRSPFNDRTVIYLTAYGPEGAVLGPGSDPPVALEPALAGHPATGWFVGPEPQSRATLKVVWDVPALAHQRADGTWELPLRWVPVPDHAGDLLTLRVDLPPHWAWQGPVPPATFTLETEVNGVWLLRP